MSARPQYQDAVASSSGAFTTKDASSAVTAGTAVLTKDVTPARGIVANVSLGFYTLNLAVRGKWQGSADNSTWTDFAESNNAAQVTMQSSTGTFSAAVVAPPGVLAKEYARYALYIVGGSTGTASDTYTVSYSYARNNGFNGFTP